MGALRRIGALLVLALAIYLRRVSQSSYNTLSTMEWMPVFGAPFQLGLFAHNLGQNLLNYGLGCFLTGLLLVVAAWLWRRSNGTSRMLFWLERPWVCPLLAFLFAIFVRNLVFHNYEAVTDESAMTFQADVFLSGHWTAPAPLGSDHFANPALIVHQGRWSYVGAPGWSILLAVGALFQLQDWVNPLLLALCVFLMQSLSRSWHGASASAWTGAMALASPALLLNGSSGYGHLATLVWALATLFCLERVLPGQWKWSTLAGICLGMMVSTRHVDAALFGMCVFLWRVVLRDPNYSKPGLAQVVTLAAGALVSMVPWFLQNQALSGNPLVTGYQVQGVVGSFMSAGLGLRLHIGSLAFFRMLFWVTPFWLELTVLACVRDGPRIRMMALILLLNLLFYAHPDMYGIGSRYLVPSFGLILTCCGGTIHKLWLRYSSKLGALLPVFLLYTALAIYPGYIRTCDQVYSPFYRFDQWLCEVIGRDGIGLLRLDPLNQGMGFCINRPDLSGPIRGLSLGPEEDRDLLASYPGRRAIYIDYNPAHQNFDVVPFDRSKDDLTLLCAGANYANVVEKPREALRQWQRIPPSSPYRGAALTNSARLLRRLGRVDEAAQMEAEFKLISP